MSEIINDFLITLDGDDFGSSVSDIAIRNIALRGIREFGFDISKKIKSIKRNIESNQTITLPDDYVDLSKLGVVGSDGLIYILSENKNINYSRKLDPADGTEQFDAGPLNIGNNSIKDRVDDKTGTEAESQDNDFIFTCSKTICTREEKEDCMVLEVDTQGVTTESISIRTELSWR